MRLPPEETCRSCLLY